MGEFRYPHTCPDIDKNIKAFKDSLEEYLTDLFDYICPPSLVDSNEAQEIKKDYLKYISNEANNCFENVRTVNSDMRDEVEKVLKDGNDRIEELEYTIKELEGKIDDLEEQLDDWRAQYKH